MNVDPITPSFAAVCTGVDLKAPLDAAAVSAIAAAGDRYGLLVFPGQFLETDQLVTFGRYFGPLDSSLQQKLMNRFQTRLNNDEVSDISNLAVSGAVAPRDHPQVAMNVGNRFWHSDRSFADYPDRYSIWSGITAVNKGGETEFADLRAAWDSLDEDLRAMIVDKIAIFHSHNTRDWLGFRDSEDERRAYPPVKWPMVRTHPGSGRKLLWCDSKVTRIEGLSLPESRALVHELIEHIGQRQHVYSHIWTAGDVVMSDNRCTLHRGRRFDLSEPREMRRVEVVDDVHSLGEITLDEVLQA